MFVSWLSASFSDVETRAVDHTRSCGAMASGTVGSGLWEVTLSSSDSSDDDPYPASNSESPVTVGGGLLMVVIVVVVVGADDDDNIEEELLVPGEDPIERNDIMNTGKDYAFLIGNATEQMRISRRPAGYIFVDM